LRRVAIGSCSYHGISISPYSAKPFRHPEGPSRPKDVGVGRTDCPS
jgi:hypothetical protein